MGCRTRFCGVWDAGYGVRDVGYGMQDVGCRTRGAGRKVVSPSRRGKRRGKASHPEMCLPLTHSVVDSRDGKAEGSPPFPVLVLALPLEDGPGKSTWGLGCQKVPIALPSLHRHPQIRHFQLELHRLPREPCQVGGVGNIHFLHSSSVSRKGKDGLCLPAAAPQREGKASTRRARSLGKASRSGRRAGVKPPGSTSSPKKAAAVVVVVVTVVVLRGATVGSSWPRCTHGAPPVSARPQRRPVRLHALIRNARGVFDMR